MTDETIGFIALLIFFAVVGLVGMYFISRTAPTNAIATIASGQIGLRRRFTHYCKLIWSKHNGSF